MSEKSELIDLNSDVVLGDNLNGQEEAMGSSSVEVATKRVVDLKEENGGDDEKERRDEILKKCTGVEVVSSVNEAKEDDSVRNGEERLDFEGGKASDADEISDKGACFGIDSSFADDESLPIRDLKVSTHFSETLASDGLANRELEVNIIDEDEAGKCVSETMASKSDGNVSDKINIVIDLSPTMGKERDVSRFKKGKSAASKPEFRVGDLVWGKVRSHPWWPAQILDPSTSSKKAKKYFKRDSYLVGYFGDNTFAWNDASRIKPFVEHFSVMEKLSSTEDFHCAVNCALEEISRRVEFGLACSCLSEEVYAKIKSQIIINAGIRPDSSRRDCGDRSLSVASFEPVKLVEYMKEVAQFPCGRADRLELEMGRAQLSAFYHWKGYSELPEYNLLGGLLENDAEIDLGQKKLSNEGSEAAAPEHEDNQSLISEKGKSKGENSSLSKRKLTAYKDSSSRKKEKSLLNLMAKKGSQTPSSDYGSASKAVSKKRKAVDAISDDFPEEDVKSVSHKKEKSLVNLMAKGSDTPSSDNGSASKGVGKKRKAVDANSDDLPVKKEKLASDGVDSKSVQPKKSFIVGDCIRRVASLLNGTTPMLKNGDGMSQRTPVQPKEREEIASEKSETGKLVEPEYSHDDMLSQLCLTATNPLKVHGFLVSMTKFFSEFRNTVSTGLSDSDEDEQPLEHLFGFKTGKKITKNSGKSNKPGITELPQSSSWSERIIRSISEDQNDETGEFPLGIGKKSDFFISSRAAIELDSKLQTADGGPKIEAEKQIESDSKQQSVDSVLEMEAEKQVESDSKQQAVDSVFEMEAEKQIELDAKQQTVDDALEVEAEKQVELDSKQQTVDGNLKVEPKKLVTASNETGKEEVSPTALILNFTDLDSVPSQANLIDIFRPYGPLNESETEVLKKSSRAKVVFSRRSDAEKAFSSAGKYRVFGPSLVSYRLKYLPSSKASPTAKKRSKKEAAALPEGDAACYSNTQP
ncbi:hypothetical protein UlMin_005909 [Ulmus minor]